MSMMYDRYVELVTDIEERCRKVLLKNWPLMAKMTITMFRDDSIYHNASMFQSSLRTSSRFSNIALGASAITFSILIMALLPPPPILLSIFLGGFAILFNGIGGIMQGVQGQGISRWFRAPLVGVGVLIIAISGLIIAHPIG